MKRDPMAAIAAHRLALMSLRGVTKRYNRDVRQQYDAVCLQASVEEATRATT